MSAFCYSGGPNIVNVPSAKGVNAMKYAINFANFDYLSDLKVLTDLAVDAEKSGWDAVFLWDHVNLIFEGAGQGGHHADPWIALALIAANTETVLLGTSITPVARRRPTKLAREILSLYQLAGERFVFGAGAGVAPSEFDDLGDESNLRVRADMLDEGLLLLQKLWSGEDVDHQGKYYQVKSPTFAPGGIDVPIWTAATWPNRRPFRRAAKYDGAFVVNHDFWTQLNPQEVTEITTYIAAHRDSDQPFHLSIGANTTEDRQADLAHAQAIEDAGANWWLDGGNPATETLDALRARVRRGPPTR
jgi:alkanesulfonate monooxygenase SsuD/methylene tetrahydromethanopterin reductase-like flavin-dependent oxidoreductase (luciferase family)